MPLAISAEPAPIALDADGVARVGGTRVTLDTVVTAFKLGATPEEIGLRYDSLSLSDVYGAVAYYLRHRSEVEQYLQERRTEAEEIRRFNESQIDRQAIRERLSARAAQRRAP